MSEETITAGQRKHLFALLGEAGIKNREDRLSFAREVLEIDDNDLTSFTQLYMNEADDLIFAARAWKIVQSLRDLNGEMLKESISKVRRYYNYSRGDDEDVARLIDEDEDTESDDTASQETPEADESVEQDQDESKAVRRPRRSGKASKKGKPKDSEESHHEQSRTHSGRSSKTRSGSFSSEEIGYDLD